MRLQRNSSKFLNPYLPQADTGDRSYVPIGLFSVGRGTCPRVSPVTAV
jgi:hypothetical protein